MCARVGGRPSQRRWEGGSLGGRIGGWEASQRGWGGRYWASASRPALFIKVGKEIKSRLNADAAS